MGQRGRVRVTEEGPTGLNQEFVDTRNGRHMTRSDFVHRIEQGDYPNYHVRSVRGHRIPASNPDSSEENNLD